MYESKLFLILPYIYLNPLLASLLICVIARQIVVMLEIIMRFTFLGHQWKGAGCGLSWMFRALSCCFLFLFSCVYSKNKCRSWLRTNKLLKTKLIKKLIHWSASCFYFKSGEFEGKLLGKKMFVVLLQVHQFPRQTESRIIRETAALSRWPALSGTDLDHVKHAPSWHRGRCVLLDWQHHTLSRASPPAADLRKMPRRHGWGNNLLHFQPRQHKN